MSEKSILKSFAISVIFCAALFTGCDSFFNSKKKDYSADDSSVNNPVDNPANSKDKKDFELQIKLNPRIIEHGALPGDEAANDTFQSANRSASFVPEGTISDLSITATRKKDGTGAAIATENQTTDAGNKITTTEDAENKTFTLKINKTGTWFIEVSFKIGSTTYKGKETIILTPETTYKRGLSIFSYAEDITLSTNGFGTVKLVTEYEENLTSDTPSLLPQTAQMKLKKRNRTEGTEESESYVINGTIDSSTKTVTFQKQIPSGIYFAEIDFFSDLERLSPLYACRETLLIVDDQTTDTWVISSSYLEQTGESSENIIKNEKDGPLKLVDGEVKFIITSELVKSFVQKYDGPDFYVDGENGSDYNKGSKNYPFATVQKAVDKILAVNDKQSQYTILLKSDVVEDQNAASYGSDRKYSYVKIIGNGTSASETQIKITSDSEALAAYNNIYLIEKDGFSIDANRDDSHRGAVIWAQNVMLNLENVTVRGGYNGWATYYPQSAGIHLTEAAVLTMGKNACIENNTQVKDSDIKDTGAGVYVTYNCSFVMNGGTIRNNVNLMDYHSAGGVFVGGVYSEFIMNPLKDESGNEITCAIYGNRGMAGAITVFSSGVFTMNGGVIGKPSSQVTQAADASHWGNKAEIIESTGGQGGAILLLANNTGAPKVYLNGGEICYNYAEKEGGAIACRDDANASHLVELNGTNICYNSAGPNSDEGYGGAIYAESAEINMHKGQIYGNRAGGAGGAIYLKAASAFDPDEEKLNLNIFGGKITDNLVKNGDPQPANNSATPAIPATGVKALGGAIYLGANACCQLNGGIIDQNKTYASNTSSGESYGGAIYMETTLDGTFSTYTPTDSIFYAPKLTVNNGMINANKCEAAYFDAKKRGAAIYADKVFYKINNPKVVASNNDITDSLFMVYVEGTTTNANISLTVGTNTLFNGGAKTIRSLYVCDHEVTQTEFNGVIGTNPSNFKGSEAAVVVASGEKQNCRPVEQVSWYDAIVYCNKLSLLEGLDPYYTTNFDGTPDATDWAGLVYSFESTNWGLINIYNTGSNGYRLPTSLEWEYAARDGDSIHPFFYAGTSRNNPNNVAWYLDNSGNGGGTTNPKTHEVRKKTPNALGLYDMSGNVFEWCEDDSSSNKVKRGGGYSSTSSEIELLQNVVGAANSRTNYNSGFRVVRSAEPGITSTSEKKIVTFNTTKNWPGNTNNVPYQEVDYANKATRPTGSMYTVGANTPGHGKFLGWYEKPNPSSGENPFDFDTIYIYSDTTLYAVWDFVYVAGFTFDGAAAVVTSNVTSPTADDYSKVFIQNRVLPISDLWVCDHEVTQSEYETYCKYGSTNPATTTNGNGDNYPVYYVNWYDALVYCNLRSKAEGLTPVYKIKNASGILTDNPAQWVDIAGDSIKYCGPSEANTDWNNVVCDWNANGYRLPTEAEWEYFARDGKGLSGTQYKYAGSDNVGDVAWYYENSLDGGERKTHEVKGKTANSLRLYDLSGNVWELCWDWYSTNVPATTGPYGTSSGEKRVKRGGSWTNDDSYNTVNQRNNNTIEHRTSIDGFRVVRNASSSSSSPLQKCLVTFDTTTNWPDNTSKVPPQEVFAGGNASAPSSDPTPIASGEEKHGNFLGWYTKPKPQQNPADPSVTPITPIDSPFDFENTPITTNLTLYAVWDFVYVQGATFEGNETLCKNETNKESGVFIKDRVLPIGNLWVCDHEVTQGEYETYCKYGSTDNPTTGNGDGDNYPAYYVNWYDALVYCNLRSKAEGLNPVYKIKKNGVATGELTDNPAQWVEIVSEGSGTSIKYCGPSEANTDWNNVICDWNANGYRLPTEAEWEYVARGGNGLTGTQYKYSGSDTFGDVAWYSGNAASTTHEVKGKTANSLGLYDLSGNVWELCWDLCTADVQALQAATGPYGISSGPAHIKRGGCKSNGDQTISSRNLHTAQDYVDYAGFRVVRNAAGPAPATPVKHTVTFDTTTNWIANPPSVAPVEVYDGKKINQPSEPSASDIHFRGWFTKPNPSATEDDPFDFDTTAITRDLTLYAVWDFVYVEGGTVVGSDDYNQRRAEGAAYIGAFPDGRTVTLSSFYICDHELTQGEYETYCCYTVDTPSTSKGGGADYPAYYISWYDAIVYCNLRSMAEGLRPCYSLSGETDPKKWTGIKSSNGKYSCSYTSSNSTWNSITCNMAANGYRLPTEAEWEYAARGGQETYGNGTSAFANYFAGATTTNYSASSNSDLDSVGWYSSNSSNTTHEVKKKAPNALGLYDMSGNVCEWCWDWYSTSVGTGNENDPRGASSGSNRLRRGGSWNYYAYDCSVSGRGSSYPGDRYYYLGFRLVRSAGLYNPSVPVKCTVTFDTKTNRPASSLTIEPVKVTAGKKIKQPSQTPNDPVQFRGWFTKPNPSATESSFDFTSNVITRDITLYAVYGLVYVEGGTVVGSDAYNHNYTGAFPAGRSVTLSSFYISDHELTQGEYETYCSYTSSTPSSSYGEGADYPAYYVSWYDAIVYCNLRSMAENLTPCYALGGETDPRNWTGTNSSGGKYFCSYESSDSTWDSITCNMAANGYRLPTEAEWEYAARGGKKTYGTAAFANYFAGATTTNYTASRNSDLDSVGWYKYNICNNGVTGSEGSSGAAGYGTHEVKKKAPNALGLYDMSGNVDEWCWDWEGSISTSETVADPCGASSGSRHLKRGGSWDVNAHYSSVSFRNYGYPYYRYNYNGFRLVRSAR